MQDADELGKSVHGLGRHFTSLATEIGSAVNPALGQTAGLMSMLAREVSKVSTSTLAMTTAVALGVVALSNIIRQAQEARDRQVALNDAIQSFDSGKMVAEIDKANRALIEYRENQRIFRDPFGNLSLGGAAAGAAAGAGAGALAGAPFAGVGAGPGALIGGALGGLLGAFSGSLSAGAGLLFGRSEADLLRDQAEDRARYLREFFPAEAASQIATNIALVQAAMKTLGEIAAEDAVRAADLNRLYDAQSAALEALAGKQKQETAALEAKQAVERKQFEGKFGAASPEFLLRQQTEREALTTRQQAETTATTLAYNERAVNLQIQQLETRRALILLQGEYVVNEEAGIRLNELALGQIDALIAKLKARGSSEKELLELLQLQTQERAKQAERIGLQGDIRAAGLQQAAIGQDQATRNRLALEAEENRRQTALAQAGLTLNPTDRQLQIDKANAQANAAIAQLQYAQQVQQDPLAGLAAGFQEAADQAAQWGTGMRTLALDTARGMEQAFSDGFFDVLTGNFKDLPDLARRFSADMVRAVSSELARLAVAPILSQVRGLIGGGSAATVPFASLAAPVVTTTAGRPLAQSELSTAYVAAGESGVRALQTGQAAVVSGQYIPETYDLPGFSTGTVALAPPTAATAGLLSRALPVASSAALLGLTAYGARGAQSNFDVGTSAALGGLAGLSLGRSTAGLFGASEGAGGATGALAGAVITGVIAYLAKQEADRQKARERQMAEVTRATGAGSDLVRSAAGATSLADFFRRVTAYGSGYTGGTSPVAVGVSVQTPFGPRAIGVPNPTYPVATLQDLLANPLSLQAGIQAGVSPDLLAGPNAATSTALQQIAQDLVRQYQAAAQGVALTQVDQTPGGLTVRTGLPATRAAALDPTRDVQIDQLALAALSSDDQALLLHDTMARVLAERDVTSTISDGATGQIVSITRIPRSTTPLPADPGAVTPPPPPPGVPPAAVPAIQAVSAFNIPRFTEPRPIAPVGAPIYSSSSEGSSYQIGTEPVTAFQQATYQAALEAYAARQRAFYQPYVEQLSPLLAGAAREQLAALTPGEVQAAIRAGLITEATVGTWIQAGLLPQVRALVPPELQPLADLPPGGGDVAGLGSAGLVGVPGNITLPAAVQGFFSGLIDTPASQGVAALMNALNVPNPTINLGLGSLNPRLSGLIATLALQALPLPVAAANSVLGGLLGFARAIQTQPQFDPTTAFSLANAAPQADIAGMVANAMANNPFAVQALAQQGFNVTQLAIDFAANPNLFSQSWADLFTGNAVPSPTQGYHTAANPSFPSLPTDPNATNFGQGNPGGTGATPSGGDPGSGGTGPGGVQGP